MERQEIMKRNRLLAIFLIVAGFLLYIDEAWNLHFLGDLSAWDNYNPVTKHWMVGLIALTLGGIWFFKQRREKT